MRARSGMITIRAKIRFCKDGGNKTREEPTKTSHGKSPQRQENTRAHKDKDEDERKVPYRFDLIPLVVGMLGYREEKI